MSKRPENAFRKYKESVLTTWEISFKAIEEENPKAAELLLLCGCLGNDDILEEMIRRGWELDEDGMILTIFFFLLILGSEPRTLASYIYIIFHVLTTILSIFF